MPHYYRVMLGAASAHAAECIAEGFIGTFFGFIHDLTAASSWPSRTIRSCATPSKSCRRWRFIAIRSRFRWSKDSDTGFDSPWYA
jgi:hypothetical protein